jgi:hypothetical protein
MEYLHKRMRRTRNIFQSLGLEKLGQGSEGEEPFELPFPSFLFFFEAGRSAVAEGYRAKLAVVTEHMSSKFVEERKVSAKSNFGAELPVFHRVPESCSKRTNFEKYSVEIRSD